MRASVVCGPRHQAIYEAFILDHEQPNRTMYDIDRRLKEILGRRVGNFRWKKKILATLEAALVAAAGPAPRAAAAGLAPHAAAAGPAPRAAAAGPAPSAAAAGPAAAAVLAPLEDRDFKKTICGCTPPSPLAAAPPALELISRMYGDSDSDEDVQEGQKMLWDLADGNAEKPNFSRHDN